MRRTLIGSLFMVCWVSLTFANASLAGDFYSFKVKSIQGKAMDLAGLKGKAVLVVNTASQCGYTSQYQGLQKLFSKYESKGLVVLGFPSNDFGGQEPGANAEIKKFCELNYGVKFPLFEKGAVSGGSAQPLFKWLTRFKSPGVDGDIQLNFEKFLITPEGNFHNRFRSGVEPDAPELISELERILPSGLKGK